MVLIRALAIFVLIVWLILDGVVVFRHRTAEAESRDRHSLGAIMVGNLVSWIVSIALAYTSYGALHSLPIQLVGLALMLAGIGLRSLAIAQLGHLHTPNVAVRADHRLVETGLYRHVRHPSYLGALIAFLGFGMALGNWLSIAVMEAVSIGVYLFRIHEEEAALSAAFGDAYRDYCKRTSRLLPGLY